MSTTNPPIQNKKKRVLQTTPAAKKLLRKKRVTKRSVFVSSEEESSSPSESEPSSPVKKKPRAFDDERYFQKPAAKKKPQVESGDTSDDDDDQMYDDTIKSTKSVHDDVAKEDEDGGWDGELGLKDEVGSWSEASAKVGKLWEGPTSFDAALSWMVKTATRDQFHQLIGALNLPTTPAKGPRIRHTRWLENEKTKSLLKKRKETFVNCVRQIYWRDREDRRAVLREREEERDRHEMSRDLYVSRFSADVQTMRAKSKNSYMFALIIPVNHYDSNHTTVYAEIAERVFNQANVTDESLPVRKLCSPVVCRLQVTQWPHSENIASKRRRGRGKYSITHDENSAVKVRFKEGVSPAFHYLRTPGTNYLEGSNYEERQALLRVCNSSVQHVAQCTIAFQDSIELEPPQYMEYSEPAQDVEQLEKKFEWCTWLRRKADEAFTASNHEKEPIVVEGIRHLPRAGQEETIALIRLLPVETRRYRRILKLFSQFKHVTTVFHIWNLVAEYQLFMWS